MEKLQENLGYRFKDIKMLELALRHRSMGRKNNERLEYLGDAVVDLCVRHFLYTSFPELSEGEMTMIASKMVCHDGLLQIGLSLSLEDSLKMVETDDPTFSKTSAVSDAVEAITAAIYLDGGFLPACSFIINSLLHEVGKGTISLERDAKTVLQEHLQARGLPPPDYTDVLNADGSHTSIVSASSFSFSCTGHGTNRKEAEKRAAKAMLIKLEREHL